MKNVSMIKRVGRTGVVAYQVRWPGPDKGESETFERRPDARMLVAWLRAQPHPIAKTDSAIRAKHYLHGAKHAQELAKAALTVERVAQAFLATKEAKGVARKTLDNYRVALLKHLVPLYRHHGAPRQVATVDHDDLNALYRRLTTVPNPDTGKVLVYSTAVAVMARIATMFKWAYGKKMTEFEPARARKGFEMAYDSPTLQHSESRGGLSVAQVKALIAAMPTAQDALVIRTWVAAGPRTDEIFALAVENLNLHPAPGEPPTITYTHRMEDRVRVEGTKGRRADRNNGGAEARHTVVIDPKLAKALAVHVAGRESFEPVFPRQVATHGKRSRSVWVDPDGWTRYVFNPVVAELVASGVLPVRVTPYWLRHTTCTWLWDRADSVAQVAQQMRHTDIRTTRVYRDETKVNRALLAPGVNAAFGVLDEDDAA